MSERTCEINIRASMAGETFGVFVQQGNDEVFHCALPTRRLSAIRQMLDVMASVVAGEVMEFRCGDAKIQRAPSKELLHAALSGGKR